MGMTYKRGNVWWIKYYEHGRPRYESSESDKEGDAKSLLKQREGDVARGIPVAPQLKRTTFDDLATDVVNDYKANGQKTTDELKARIENHLAPFFGGRRATSITTADIRAYITKRQAAGAKNATINREVAILSRAFSLGIESGKVQMRPHIPLLKENNVRSGFFEREQFEAVRANLSPTLQAVVTFAYITGWRVDSEILPLQWRHVDFEGRTVRLDPGTTKNGKARVFPFTDALEKLLRALDAQRDQLAKEKGIICPWVFNRKGKRVKGFRRAWKTACKKAGCPGRLKHDFRRSAVRNLVALGVPERVAMQLTGHLTRSVFDRYHIVSPGDLTDAARKLDGAAVTVTVTNAPETPLKATGSSR